MPSRLPPTFVQPDVAGLGHARLDRSERRRDREACAVAAPRTSTGNSADRRRAADRPSAIGVRYAAAPGDARSERPARWVYSANPIPVRWKSCVHNVSTPDVAVGGMTATTSARSPGSSRISPERVLEVEAADDAAFDERAIEQAALTADAHERDLRARAVGEQQAEESRGRSTDRAAAAAPDRLGRRTSMRPARALRAPRACLRARRRSCRWSGRSALH